MPDIKSIIRKVKRPSEVPGDFQAVLQHLLEEFLASKKAEIEKALDGAVAEATKDLGEKLTREITAYVLPRMPVPKNGHTPTTAEITALIKPLIPKVRNGKDADETVIVKRVLRQIREPEDGKTPTKKELLALVKPILKAWKEDFDLRLAQGLRALQSSARAGSASRGGGMGNAQHETKNVSSATTSVSLSSDVAASGRAIWASYQGQFLVYGTHYTISGKTMTLLFTPQDDTFIDITYIRT